MSAEADRLRRQLRRVQEATAADAAEAEARIERLLGRCAGLESQLAARASERSEDDFFRSIMPTRPEPRAPEPPAVPYTGPLRITAVEVKVLCVPLVRPGATCSAQDEVLVLVHTDRGFVGIGECDANPWMVKAAIEAPGTHTMGLGLREMLLGEDPREIARLWDKMYSGSKMNGRRGLVVHAIGALDMALWDIAGKAAGKPVWQLLSGCDRPAKEFITPYASLQPDASCFEAYKSSLVAWAVQAKALGFKAAKLECTLSGPYAHAGLNEPDGAKVTEVVRAVRAAVGPEFTLMVDAQYTWETAEQCLNVVRDWAGLDVFFIETPLNVDNLDEIAELSDQLQQLPSSALPLAIGHPEGHWFAQNSVVGGQAQASDRRPVKVAYGEWQSTRFEFEDLIRRGKIQVAQPDVGRVGGLTEAWRVCQLAAEHECLIVPHCWKTGIGIAATAHLAAVTNHCPFIEFLPAELTDSLLRQELTINELELNEDGLLPIPQKPGLGVELDLAAVAKYEVKGVRIVPEGATNVQDVLRLSREVSVPTRFA